jgi:hypothetical protein
MRKRYVFWGGEAGGFMASLKSTTIMAMQSIVEIQARAKIRKLKDIFGK